MGLTGQIVLSKLQIDNEKYQIISSAEDIIRFKTKNKDGVEVYETSPQILTIEIYTGHYNEGQKGEPINFKNNYRFYVLDYEDIELKVEFGEQIQKDEESTETEIINPDTLYFDIDEFVNKNNFAQLNMLIFVFEYVVNDTVITSKAFQLRDGLGAEAASFNVTAASINASVRESKLAFTEEGLQIDNGGFKIIQNGMQVFGFETNQDGAQDNSKLVMKGTVYAEDGEFTGEIHATSAEFDSGTIGGFKILPNGYYKTYDSFPQAGKTYYVLDEENKYKPVDKLPEFLSDQNYYEYSEYNSLVSTKEGLVLNGDLGKITAQNIELGDNATIKNFLALGDAKIYNPKLAANNKKFIESGNILIKDNGTANFGRIFIDGNSSKISGDNWYINNNEASFSNINVSGSIETAVFKTNSVQAAGGAMIFRPSYKGSLKNENNTFVVYLESAYEGAIGNQVQIVFDGSGQGYFGEIEAIEQNKASINWVTPPTLEKESIVLIDYGCDTYVRVAYNYPIENEKYFILSGEDEYTQITFESEDVYSEFFNKVGSDYLSSRDLSVDDGMLKSKNKLIVENDSLVNSIRNFFTRQDDILIGINSGRSSIGINSSILPRGITLTTSNTKYFDYTISTDSKQIADKIYYKKEGDQYSVTTEFIVGEVYEQTIKYKKPKLYLGDLSQVDSIYSGYGLYADNVFLNGSLTTKAEEGYAGVNTLDGASATIYSPIDLKEEDWQADKYYIKVAENKYEKALTNFDPQQQYYEIDDTNIVFWAGAQDTSDDAIQNAPFQVTEAGSLYAQRAKLQNSLLVGGTIEAAEIHTAELHSAGGALSIYDGTNGIQFKKGGDQNSEQVIFSINTSGLIAGDKNFINIDNDQNVNIVATQLRTANDTNHLSLETTNSIPVLKHTEGTNNCGFYFEKTQTVFKMNENPIQTWNSVGTQIHNTFELGKEGGCNMRYTQENNGYNLYIVTS